MFENKFSRTSHRCIFQQGTAWRSNMFNNKIRRQRNINNKSSEDIYDHSHRLDILLKYLQRNKNQIIKTQRRFSTIQIHN